MNMSHDFIKKAFSNIYVQIFLSIILTTLSSIIYISRSQFVPKSVSIIGISFITFGLFWLIIFLLRYFINQNITIWLLFPFLIFTSVGFPFLLEQLSLLDFILFIGINLGISLLLAGIHWKLFGLIIPGSILIGTSPGLYFAWENTSANNALEQTAIMLVGIAFGWGVITIASRTLTKKFVWWPLIPGGILAVVGWGLYIAGNPGSAVSFIGNTGSIGLIIFGIYILLMRRSFHQ